MSMAIVPTINTSYSRQKATVLATTTLESSGTVVTNNKDPFMRIRPLNIQVSEDLHRANSTVNVKGES
ncbi:hypothetical protein DERP_013946, partial [Dermatophagoides pteronyssinus]